MRAPEETREAIPSFHPQANGLAAISEQIKRSLDPAGILNPRRLA